MISPIHFNTLKYTRQNVSFSAGYVEKPKRVYKDPFLEKFLNCDRFETRKTVQWAEDEAKTKERLKSKSEAATRNETHREAMEDAAIAKAQCRIITATATAQKACREGTAANLERGQLLTKENRIFSAGTTEMFRSDLDWRGLGRVLSRHFSKNEKVNTVIYGCSDGSEAYSMSVLLQHNFKDKSAKFFPIVAKDIDSARIKKNIENQKKPNLVMGKEAYLRSAAQLNIFEREDMDGYMVPAESEDGYSWDAELTEKTKMPVEFKRANILEDLNSLDEENPTIFMCRNMWPYIDQREYRDFADTLYGKLAQGSVVVIGSFDYSTFNPSLPDFPSALIDAGFRPAGGSKKEGCDLIFEKR